MEKGIEQGLEQGIKRGIERGVAEGLLLGQRRVLVAQLQRRFGEIPSDVIARINSIIESGRLDELATRVLDARSLDDMGL
jgi:flagellar biosynthesis/type III secretory pathway protein FliH